MRALGDSKHATLHLAYANPQVIAVMDSTMCRGWPPCAMRFCERGGVE
jgi:hypothetical protein